MRLSKLMGFAVVLVALALAMNALAYKTAVVTNGMTLTVDTTSASKLAFDAATSMDPGVAASITNGKLGITVNDKMQPDSVYTFQSAFKITNNDTANPVVLTYSTTGLAGGVTITLLNAADDSDLASATLAASGTVQVKLRVSVPANFVTNGGTLNVSQNPSIVVTATR